MRIGQKLISGFLGITVIVGVVGYIGFNATNAIEKQASITDASKELRIAVSDARETLHKYLLTEEPDLLAEIKAEHDEYEERIEMWIEALGHGSDSADFKAKGMYRTWAEGDYEAKGLSVTFSPEIAEMAEAMEEPFKEKREAAAALITAHDEELAAKAKFNEEYPKEKDKRHAMRDIVYKSKDPELHKNYGLMIYYSKEALYQYGDQKHIDEWLESIKTLNAAAAAAAILPPAELKAFSTSLDEYFPIAETMANLTLEMKQKEADALAKMTVVDECAAKLDKKKAEITAAAITLMKETRATVTTMLIGVIIIALVLAIGLGMFISRAISAPLTKLKDAAVDIAQGNMDAKIDVKPRDEIGELAEAFDNMRTSLKVVMEEYEKREKE